MFKSASEALYKIPMCDNTMDFLFTEINLQRPFLKKYMCWYKGSLKDGTDSEYAG